MKIDIFCETCGTLFHPDQKDRNRGFGRFCSRSCSAKRKRITSTNTVCAQCAKPFYLRLSAKSKSQSGLNFCSTACKNLAQRIDGITAIHPRHYNGGKRRYRDLALRIHGKRCVGCGYNAHPDVLEVHHIDHNRCNNDPSNLAPVCPTCHREIHHGHRILVLN